jgi:hypothetical protein
MHSYFICLTSKEQFDQNMNHKEVQIYYAVQLVLMSETYKPTVITNVIATLKSLGVKSPFM